MPALFLNLLKLIFLALIYLFLWQVARAAAAHIGTGQGGGMPRIAAELVVVRSETSAGATYPLGRPLVLGRSADADIVIDDPYASDLHLRIGEQDGKVMLHDLGSTNGTYVNGRRVTVPTALNRGDSVQVGKTVMEVR
jgi:hypothetical protein